MLKKAMVALLVVAVSAHFWLWLPQIYANAAQAANETTGQVWPLNNHGHTVYVTRIEHLAQSVFTPALVIVAFAAGIWNHLSRTKDERTLTRPE